MFSSNAELRDLPEDVSIIIVNYNTRQTLCECLKRLTRMSTRLRFKIIVVDNGSDDGSAEMVRSAFPNVQLVANNVNRYYTAGSNQGARYADGKYILIMNPDLFVPEGTIERLFDFMESHPEAGASGPRFLNPDLTLQPCCWRFTTPLIDFVTSTLPGFFFLPVARSIMRGFWYDGRDRTRVYEVNVLIDAFIMLRRKLIQRIGLYDERLKLYYTEDDLCRRIVHVGGLKNFYIGDAAVIHAQSESIRRVPIGMVRRIRLQDMLAFHRKYYGEITAIGLMFLRTATIVIISICEGLGLRTRLLSRYR